VIAYKFLAPGAVAPFARLAWPRDGGWVEGDPSLCRSGVHACRFVDLAYWLGPELWEVELDGEIVEGRHKVAASRGRLVRRVQRWNDETRAAFVAACVARGRALGAAALELAEYVRDLDGVAAVGAGLTGYAVARMREELEGPVGFEREREWQGLWLADALGLG